MIRDGKHSCTCNLSRQISVGGLGLNGKISLLSLFTRNLWGRYSGKPDNTINTSPSFGRKDNKLVGGKRSVPNGLCQAPYGVIAGYNVRLFKQSPKGSTTRAGENPMGHDEAIYELFWREGWIFRKSKRLVWVFFSVLSNYKKNYFSRIFDALFSCKKSLFTTLTYQFNQISARHLTSI